MAILSERTWRSHANPISGWSRILTHPLVYVPLWNRSWLQGAAVGAWFALNPTLFREPRDDRAWVTRAVYGEQLWTERVQRQLRSRQWRVLLTDPNIWINAASAAAFVPALYSAWKRRLGPTALWASTALGLQMLYLRNAEHLYTASRSEVS